MAFAFCDRRGVIEIASYTPAGMLPLGKGKGVRTWLVPGVPEAETEEQALQAATVFRDRVAKRLKGGA